MKSGLSVAGLATLCVLPGKAVHAVEGGIGAYFLGTRDTFAGVVPPPGTYISLTYDHLEGSVEGLSVGGLPVRGNADISLNLYRFSFTQAFDATLWGGTPAINVTIPFPDTNINISAVAGPIAGAQIEDDTFGFGDVALSGILGWHQKNMHYSTGLTVFAPTGSYDTATVNLSGRSVDVLSNGKNVWSFMPTVAATYLNQNTGLEVSGVASLLFSTKNDATDFQTAPALQLEGTVMQRFRSGWGVGLTGYTYQQWKDDSGSGADALKAVLGVNSLKARVSGIGPIVTYSGGELFGGDLSVKLKYTTEFEAEGRLESDIFTAVLSLSF